MEVRTVGPAVITEDTDRLAVEALEQWTALVGAEHVIADDRSRKTAETATFATTQRVPAILRPGSRDEVQECMRIANRFRIPVYPISSGKNWGYGSRVPVTDASVLIDLSRLNRILDFNEKLAYVTVEPGVTQRQLFQLLQDRHSSLWMDATGSSPDCSLIGNAVERGIGGRAINKQCKALRLFQPTYTSFREHCHAEYVRLMAVSGKFRHTK